MQNDKNTIAWFKIAECVSRGEKERALGVYRLLSHSFNDEAVARQLEGDIYLAFNEYEFAIALYQQSMELYQKSDRLLEAAAICEHLIVLRSHDLTFRKEAIKLHSLLNYSSKAQEHIQKSIDILIATENDYVLQEFLSTIRIYSEELYEYALIYKETTDN